MILITGGTGLLGTHLLPELINSGEKVRVLIREPHKSKKVLSVWKYYYKNAESLFDKIDWFKGDVTNKADVYDALEKVEKVYHCAACVSFDKAKKLEMFEVNVLGTRNVVDICIERNIKKLLHVSSIAAIGSEADQEFLTEENNWPTSKKSVYSLTKTLAEQEVWRGMVEGLNAVIVNPSIIIGAGYPGQNSFQFFERVNKGLKYYTNGVTGFVDVRDVVKAMVLLMDSEINNERFILNGANLSYMDLFVKISSTLGVAPPHKYATKLLTSIAWKAEFILSILAGRNPKITSQTANSAHKIQKYSSLKLTDQTGFSFREIDDTIKDIGQFYLQNVK
jgi:dihydroflavonol-4-reductase